MNGGGGVRVGHELVEGIELTGWSHRSASASEGPGTQSPWEGERRGSLRLLGWPARVGPRRAGRELEELGLGLLWPEEEEGKGVDWASAWGGPKPVRGSGRGSSSFSNSFSYFVFKTNSNVNQIKFE